jgi:pSer/pThr/pTyr-binding forkhead associated (FHA) protein
LKVDERKLPAAIRSFKCPACRKAVPVSLLEAQSDGDVDTVLIRETKKKERGSLTVIANEDSVEQVLTLQEGMNVIGRKSASSQASLSIVTEDLLMSREHIRIEVKKDERGGYKHYLSDNKSRNRTLYKGSYLEEGEVAVLDDQDEIIIGHTTLRFHG